MPAADFISKSDFVNTYQKYLDAVKYLKNWNEQVTSLATTIKSHPDYITGLDENEKISLDQNISLVSSVLVSLQSPVVANF